MLPHFNYEGGSSSRDEMCESCSSELETQIKPLQVDEIEGRGIMNKFEEAEVKEIGKIINKLSDDESKEIHKEAEKFHRKFLKRKEKELNDKILAERER